LRRRRALIVTLTLTAIVVQFVQASRNERQTASARTVPRTSPSVAVKGVSPSSSPRPAVVAPSAPKPSASASPTPSPKGPPFVLDAAPSCAGKTALIDIQIAGTARRPVSKLELFLDGAAAPLTPAPSTPLTSYAGRSSGTAAPGGSGQWMVRALDADGIADTRVYPYACG
jgi:hypothetical protein